MLRRSLIFLALLFGVYGCAGAPKTIFVNVPIAVACVPQDFAAEPAYVDNDVALKSADNVFERVKLLLIGRLERIKRLKEFEAAITACRGAT